MECNGCLHGNICEGSQTAVLNEKLGVVSSLLSEEVMLEDLRSSIGKISNFDAVSEKLIRQKQAESGCDKPCFRIKKEEGHLVHDSQDEIYCEV